MNQQISHGYRGWQLGSMKSVLCALISFMTVLANAEWTPPAHPTRDDVEKIRQEAKADTRAGRHEDSLAKHVWYHQNALKIDKSFCAVRLTFDLGDWVKLGAAYPPALNKLKAVRDEAGREAREGPEYHRAFADFAAISGKLRESPTNATEHFRWLDANKPAMATNVFDVAFEILILTKEYRLCGKYLDPDARYERILALYRDNVKGVKRSGPLVRVFVGGARRQQEDFCNYVSTLVAVLVLGDRKAEGERIAAKAASELKEAEFKQRLEKANNGELPGSWKTLRQRGCGQDE